MTKTTNTTTEDPRTTETTHSWMIAAKEEHDRLENEIAELLMIIATHEQTIERLTNEVLQAVSIYELVATIEEKIDKLLEMVEFRDLMNAMGAENND